MPTIPVPTRLRRARLALALLLAICTPSARAWTQTCTTGPRIPFAGHTLPLDSLPDPSAMTATRVYPNVALSQPLFLTSPPDATGRIFVVEKGGRIKLLPANPSASTSTVFLDLSGVVVTSVEQGLLGLAFDPGYATNRRFYVDYIAAGARCQTGPYCTKLVRYQASATDPNVADPATATELLQIPRSNVIHYAGMLAFGPDGMLYSAQGDDGNSANAQDLAQLKGKILRLDVRGATYAIPPDNPFVGQANRRGEIWAYGLRNPWRFSFDRLTGDLWIGEVGQDAWEEIDFVPAGSPGGANFGWPYCEGTHSYGGNNCASLAGATPPLYEFSHQSGAGQSITGGYVYRGDRLTTLYGAYVYGDYALERVSARAPLASASVILASVQSVASFGEGPDGEVYVVSIGGALYRLDESTPGTQQFPTTLSGTGLFANVASLTPQPGLVEYDVASPLWSDNAIKRRWLALPGTQRIAFSPAGIWDYPVGTVFVKHFELPTSPTTRRRVETRILLRQVDRWVGYTYRWNTAQTDATLLTASTTDVFSVDLGGGPVQQTWRYPSPAECLGCHTAAAGRVLGGRTVQLNRNFAYEGGTDAQLHAWGACLGLFDTPLEAPTFYGALADPANTAEPLAARARSYLDANCAHCHQPGGPAPGGLDLRHTPLLGGMNLIGVAPTEGDLGITGAQRIRVGSKAQSVLWHRLQSTDGAIRMPKGSLLPDPLGVALVGSWIDTGLATLDSDLDGQPDATDNCAYEASASQSDGGRWLSSSPDGIGDACQCGNVDSSGAVNVLDLVRLRQYLAGTTSGISAGLERRLSYTDDAGRPSILDVTRFRRSLATADAPLAQTCPAATRLVP